MGQLAIEVNGKPYVVGCEDGDEARLKELARMIDAQVRQVSIEVGQLGETRLLLMGALMIADELSEAKLRLERAEAESGHLRQAVDHSQAQVAHALDAAARRIEAITAL